MRRKAKIIGIICCFILLVFRGYIVWKEYNAVRQNENGNTGTEAGDVLSSSGYETGSEENDTDSMIQPKENVLEKRILAPSGYERTEADAESLTSFLRKYPLKEDGSPVLLYDGNKKKNQKAHIAVCELPLENEDLQQCADSIMRIYAEYFWKTEQYDRILFHFVDGFPAKYEKWREGYRIQVNDNHTSWVKASSYDDTYECFQKYLRMVFSYSSTLSMAEESEAVDMSHLQVGDIFIKAGSPGHVVMVIDICENQDGKKAFLLGQGYMPAQEFHVLKNNAHENDPWYYEEEITYPFSTPEYTFPEGSLRHLNY